MSALIDRLERVLAERAATSDVAAVSIADRLLVRFDRLRRRVIPRSHRWRLVKATAAAISFVALVAAAYGALIYWRGEDERRINAAAADLRYEQPLEAVNGAILTLREIAVRSSNPEVIHFVVARLKAVVLTHTDETDHGRAIRKHALETIKSLRQNSLTNDFVGAGLKDADLVDVDLSRTNMKGVSLEDAFLMRTNFSAADLTNANLSGAYA